MSNGEDTPNDEGSRSRREEHRVRGDQLLSKIKDLIHEGNVRRITIKNEEGKALIEIPLSFGVVGALLLPVWAGVGAIAAVVSNCSIEVERHDKADDDEEDAEADGVEVVAD